MAENPATWGRAEHIVNDVLEQAETDSEICGLSVERQITDALRNAGLLMEERSIERDQEVFHFSAGDPCPMCGAAMIQLCGGVRCLSDHK